MENGDVFDMRNDITSILDNINSGSAGISTGLPSLDKVINGFRDGEFIIIAGSPSIGKSSLIRGMCLNISKNNTVLLSSLEMGYKEICEICLTSISKLNYSEVVSQPNNPKYKKRLELASKQLSKHNFLIWDSAYVSTELLRAKIEEINCKEKVDIVFVDYLQLMTIPNKENRQVEIATVSRELKLMALDFNIPIIALSQLNRQNEHRDDRRPTLGDLRDSGALAQDVDKCILLHRPSYWDIDTRDDDGVAELIIAKNRKGPRNVTVSCGWVSEYMMFYDMNPPKCDIEEEEF